MTFEINNISSKFIEQYMYKHSQTILILLKKEDDENYTVLYANAIAMNLFSKNTLMSAEHFFGESWAIIHKEIKVLNGLGCCNKNLLFHINGEDRYYNLNVHSKNNESFFLEMCEQESSTVEEKRLDDLQIKYESLIENSLDSIITINKAGEIINSNSAILPAFGFDKNELVKQSFYHFIQHDQIDLVKLMIKDGFSGVLNETTELNVLHKDKLFLPSLVKIVPISNNGTITELTIILRDLSKYYEYNEKFLFLSFRDQLTGLYNRRALKKDFIENRLVAQKYNQKIAVIHIGLDRFKLINDALGHNGADEILKAVAKRMSDICPMTCKVYRNGGDEFIVLVNKHSVEVTEKIAKKILNIFDKPFYLNDSEYYISASIGISIFPDNGINIEKLVQNSEQAMSYVKENGRSHFRFYADEMQSLMSDEVLLESHLRRAIELDELEVYYQPQVDLKTGHISSFEALLRWNNRKFGFVSPGQFIKIAEDSGLIHSIGDWVLEHVCLQLNKWQQKSYKEVSIAVNISPKQFNLSGFSLKVAEIIKKHQVKPCSLELEITESSLGNMKETLLTLNELKVIGVSISVDDFGTGYSSLSYLKQYPIDIIKIDQSFIKDIETDEKNKAIAKTIINLAHNLGMEVIAEGVERQLQAKILLHANCQKAQGFLYSKALPAKKIIEKYLSCNRNNDDE